MIRRNAQRMALATVLAAACGLAGAHADELADCRTASSPEARLAACSAVIANAAAAPEQKAIAHWIRGRLRFEAGALAEALADLGAAIGLDPNEAQATGFRAQVHVARGDLPAAIADFGTLIRLRPNSTLGYSGRGHAYLVQGNARAAIDDFAAAIRLTPQSATAHNNRGLAYKAAGDLDSAVADFTTAIALNPIYALAYNNRAYVHEQAGRKAEAIADFRSALLADPALAGARDGLTRLGAGGEAQAESQRLADEGKALVERHCGFCHATGKDGASANPAAPAFRTLHARHPMQALREPLTRGIAAPHDTMPKFRLPDVEIDKIIAYINSLERR